jgi:hypothetical protein
MNTHSSLVPFYKALHDRLCWNEGSKNPPPRCCLDQGLENTLFRLVRALPRRYVWSSSQYQVEGKLVQGSKGWNSDQQRSSNDIFGMEHCFRKGHKANLRITLDHL